MTLEWWPKTRDGEMLQYLSEDEWTRLMSLTESCAAEPGDMILKKGSPSRSLLLVEQGEIEVVEESLGETVVLATLGPGKVVGEVGFIDGQPRTHGVRAKVKCRLRRLPRESLLKMVPKDPALFAKLTIALAELIAQRFRLAVKEFEPVRAFAASLQEPMELEEATFDEIESEPPEPTGGAVELLKEFARKKRDDLAGV